MTKRIWTGCGLKTPAFAMLNDETDFDAVVAEYGLPLMVKPADEGSSVGMTKVTSQSNCQKPIRLHEQYDSQVFAEQWVTGTEYTIAIVGDAALPVIRVETDSDFYDYEAKYQSDDTRYLCPCGLAADAEQEMQTLAKQAFDLLGATGWGRIDLMQDESGQAWLIELNTVPGMTSHSLVPKAAAAAGISFGELVVKILETAEVIRWPVKSLKRSAHRLLVERRSRSLCSGALEAKYFSNWLKRLRCFIDVAPLLLISASYIWINRPENLTIESVRKSTGDLEVSESR